MADIQEVLKKVKAIQIHTRRTVNDVLAGEYSSVFKGRGMEFDEVREYVPGDDVRSIDWNVTARMGHPYVKRFVEERELTVLFVVDLSASGAFGSVHALKNEVAAEVCAMLAFSAIKNHDKVGLVIFTDLVELYIPPKKGTRHVLRVIRELLYFKPRKANTDIAGALDFAGKVSKKRGVLFLVSDFLGSAYEKPLRILGKRHDIIAVSITDPREVTMPDVGLVELEDAETGEVVLLDTGSRSVRAQFEREGRERMTGLKTALASSGVDQIEVMTDRDYVRSLVRFFRSRERRAKTA
jgi:uncharacterized protein (DUF58 family)